MKDLDELALAMPLTTCERSADGRPSYLVGAKLYCCHRADRKDAVDAKGARLDDVLMFRVGDLEAKELLLGDTSSPYFTTPHFNGYPAVLLRIAHLKRIHREELFELVADAWLTRASKRAAAAWLAEHDL
ncbi:MAG TPA: hypothetical protein VGZ33_05200 [Acidimicrobiales bacterium]|jgi:hypothetical protein|nr:hypothetical protein [Acidimicrobiales bacterium]